MFLEVDEKQHRFGYDALVSCDMERMSHVMETLVVELGDTLPYVFWLRYNPDSWHVNAKLQRVQKAEREARLLRWLNAYVAVRPLQVGYAFYDVVDGALEVLQNDEYHSAWRSVTVNLAGLSDLSAHQ